MTRFDKETKALTVFKASAGSGKTFTLSKEYIKLLIVNPQNYQSILAVTFTNKATEEMKLRILSQLYGLAHNLPDSQTFMKAIASDLDCSPAIISKQANIALTLLIHKYNYFNVETIDAFFQSVLRNLARELDLTAKLHIGLQDAQIEEVAIDQLIESLTTSSPILQWIKEYVAENISEDKNWNVIRSIKHFGMNIFKERYKSFQNELNVVFNDENFFRTFRAQLIQIRAQSNEEIQNIVETFFDALDAHGLSIDMFLNKSRGVCGYFIKLRNGRITDPDDKLLTNGVKKALNDPLAWTAKSMDKSLKTMVDSVVINELFNILQYAEEQRPELRKKIVSADLTLKNINQLRLLKAIEQKIHDLNRDANRFLLSDTQTLLNSLISDSDSPFIFEKIGSRIEHVMIDEFQDTSVVQWQNFKILLNECISHSDNGNLIVGDVKQSIYRWRSGDWRLLNNIEKEFPQAQDSIDIKTLDTNYRSERNVVTFNNAFFNKAQNIEYQKLEDISPYAADQLLKAYKDVAQKVPQYKEDKGSVHVKLYPEDTYKEDIKAEISHIIKILLEGGVACKDIAILVRTNKDIPIIADHLKQQLPNVNIMSDEAFRLDASIAVNTIIAALHVIVDPNQQIYKAVLLKNYHAILKDNLNECNLFVDQKNIDNGLPIDFSNNLAGLSSLPLTDMVDEIIRLFHIENLQSESAYLCAFHDKLSSYIADNTADIVGFLEEWDESLHSNTVQCDEADGVRIVSIHKSKGLEFDNVIVAYADWMLEMQGETLWCKTKEEPFCKLPIIPIDYSLKMKESVYEADYAEEYFQNRVDNLNLLYVAFTRAAKNLFILGKRKGKNNYRSLLIEQSLEDIAQKLDCILDGTEDEQAVLQLDYGQLYTPSTPKEKKLTNNVFLQPADAISVDIRSYKTPLGFKQSNKSRDFINDDIETNNSQYIKLGNVLHSIFSQIHILADIPKVLANLEAEGILYDEDITVENVKKLLLKATNNAQVKNWFSPQWTLHNECNIISLDNNRLVEHRPDRVMSDDNSIVIVDFKFGQPKPQHAEQVKEYMQLASQMSAKEVSGFLWYVYQNNIVAVK